MIKNFEESTAELTEDEIAIMPLLIKGLQAHTKENPIKAPDIVKSFNKYLKNQGYRIQLTDVRLRKFSNYIRSRAILPLIATPAGYFVSYERADIQAQINSLTQRANSINTCAAGLSNFINK